MYMKLPVDKFFDKLKEELIRKLEAGEFDDMEDSNEFDDFEDSEDYVSQEELEQLPVFLALRDSIKNGMTLDEMIEAFASMCRLAVGEPDDLLFETGTYNFTGKKLFYFSLVRQFQYKNGDEYIQLHLDICYTPSPATARICDTEWGSLLEGDFFDMVRSSTAYAKVKEKPIASVEVHIEET